MGFFSNIKNRARGMANDLAPSNMPMQELRAGQIMPNSPQLDRRPSPRMPAPPARFDRATAPVLNPGNIGGNLGSDFRMPQMPQKRSGLGGLFRKLQEQIKNQQRPQQIPQQDLDFLSRLPKNMMPNLDFSNIPQLPENFKFNPQMGQGGRSLNFADYKPQDRQMMAGGRDVNIDDGGMVDFLNSDPRQKLFGIENRIGMLQNQLKEAEANRDRESFDMIVQEINNADAQRIEIMNSMKPNPITQDFQQRGFDQGRTISDLDDILSSLEKKN